MADEKVFKVLSIDGGGIKGLYSLYILDEIEKKYCIPNNKLIGDYFDMISGCSVGSMIIMGISLKIPISKIIEGFEKNATNIFPIGNNNNTCTKFFSNMYYKIQQLRGCKYSDTSLYKLLINIFGNKTIKDINNLVCIPSFCLNTGKNFVFKNTTDKHKDIQNITIVDMILCSSAAPTYLPIRHIKEGYFLDGGLWANDPSFLSVIETLKRFVGEDKQYQKYKIFSIGNIKSNNGINPKGDKKYFSFTKIEDLISIIFDSNVQCSQHFCKIICKYTGGEIIRIENTNYTDKINLQLDNTDSNFLQDLKSNALTDYNTIIDEHGDKILELFMYEKTHNLPSKNEPIV